MSSKFQPTMGHDMPDAYAGAFLFVVKEVDDIALDSVVTIHYLNTQCGYLDSHLYVYEGTEAMVQYA